jgi:hypothetical protein
MTAPWAARRFHSTVIDARTRAIYVIGGQGTDNYQDVWASTDGGARPDSVGWSGDTTGVVGGYTWGTQGARGCTKGFVEYSRGSPGIPLGHPRGTRGLRWGTLSTHGYSRGSSGGTYLRACVDCACPRACVCVDACVCASVRVGAVWLCFCVRALASGGFFLVLLRLHSSAVRVSECARVCVRACVCCSFHGGASAGIVSGSLCVRARAFVCVRGTLCGIAVPSASIFARACVCACMRVRRDCVCAHRRCVSAVAARRRPAVLIARPAAPGGRAFAVAV